MVCSREEGGGRVYPGRKRVYYAQRPPPSLLRLLGEPLLTVLSSLLRLLGEPLLTVFKPPP